ncbi:MAG: enoyl-CoA hydratase-related protein [bacterium]
MARVKLAQAGAVLEITLDHPPANAIDQQASRDLDAAFDRLRDDPELRVAIVRATGDRIFCAGWDLKEVAGGDAGEDFGGHGFMGLTERFDLNKPVIVAVNGLCVGGGFELALACNMVIASPQVEFGLPELHRGFLPEAGGLLRVPRRLPRNIGLDLLLTGRRLTAEEGFRLGFVNRMVPPGDVDSTAREIAETICKAAPLAVEAAMEVLREVEPLAEPEAFIRMRSGLPAFTRMRQSEDFSEGPRAFAEKRAPRWRGC